MKDTKKIISSDEALLAKYQSDLDIASLGVLYNRYMELIFGVCMKYLKNVEESEDAVMGIYELIATKLNTHKVENFRSWLYTVTRNFCLEKLRKAKQDLTKEKEIYRVQSQHYFHPDEVNEQEALYTLLQKCREQLPKVQKKMIDLFYYQKISYKEIVAQEQMEWNLVRSNIQNGRRNLKRCIEAHG